MVDHFHEQVLAKNKILLPDADAEIDPVPASGGGLLMAATSSCTLQKTPRRRCCCVSLLNQLSTRLSHEEPVGVKCSLKRGWGGQPLANRFMLVGSVVVQDDVQGEVGRERTVEAPQELQNS